MVVLVFLTDPDVVGKTLRHLGLPSCAPALSPARRPGMPLRSYLPETIGAGEGEQVGQTKRWTIPSWPSTRAMVSRRRQFRATTALRHCWAAVMYMAMMSLIGMDASQGKTASMGTVKSFV